nr:hypothetical protein [Pseudanabaena sp. PCC 7367]
MSNIEWTTKEREVAQEIFDRAYERETGALVEEIRDKASLIAKLEDVWQLHDYLSAKRHNIDGKYDFRDAYLVFVFSQLVKEGWVELNELEDLSQDKLKKISALTRM